MLPRCLATRSRLHFPAPRRDLKDQTSSHLKIATSLRLPIHFHGVTLFIPIPASFTVYTSKTSMASGTIQMRSIFISLACLNSTSVHSVGLEVYFLPYRTFSILYQRTDRGSHGIPLYLPDHHNTGFCCPR